MAIYNGRILMRKGNEADFDASKLMSGEWAVSLDAGIVRICLEAGKVIRMATYEAFEEDMKQIEAILLECQSIEEAVRRINTEVNNKLNACAEYVQQAKGYSEQAKQYRDEALQFRNEAEQFAPEGYAELKEQVNENTFKIDTVIAKADLGIKETASGEEIHLTDSAEGKAVEFALFGKARQNTTSGKNKLDVILGSQNVSGIDFTVDNGKVMTNGTATEDILLTLGSVFLEKGEYKLSGCPSGGGTNYRLDVRTGTAVFIDNGSGCSFTIAEDITVNCCIRISSGKTLNSQTFYPMISVEGGEYEPFTNGASPNPQFPQSIEVSGESYNLLENTATSQTINGVEFVVNEDKSITVNGTATDNTFRIMNNIALADGDYILSSGGADILNSAYLFVNVIDENGTTIETNRAKLPNKSTFNTANERCSVGIGVIKGTTVDNLTFYPMIRKASVKNDRYMPYGVGSVEVKSVGKNLFDIDDRVSANFHTNAVIDEEGYVNVTLDNSSGTGNAYCNFWTNPSKNIKPNKKYKIICDNQSSSNCSLFAESTNANNKSQFTTKEILVANGLTVNTITSISDFTNCQSMIRTFASVPIGEKATIKFRIMVVEEDVTDTTYQPYKETLATIPTPNGLAGIKVSSNGNYTDQNGQQWICDEIVKYADGSGAYIQRIGNLKLTSNNATRVFSNHISGNGIAFDNLLDSAYSGAVGISDYDTLTNSFANQGFLLGSSDSANKTIYWCGIVDRLGLTTVEGFKTWLGNRVIKIYYILATPIETPLTAEEIAEISTFYPVTNISNDFDCGMRVKYNCDSKNYIDNKIALLTTAMVNSI